jgi:predicted MFS family arabinose efflux permease
MTVNPSKNFSAFCILAAGVGAAMHIGKLPPALPVLGQVLGVTLLQAGFLLSSMQMAGMLLGLMTGLAVQRVGLKRSMMLGLLVVALGSALGAQAQSAAWLLATRAMEGLGFLWVVLPAPALLRQSVVPQRVNRVMGFWGAYMPLGTSLGLLLGPYVMHLALPDMGWRVWWNVLSVWCALLALLVLWRVPADATSAALNPPNQKILSLTLRSRPAWLLALSFAAYSGQWLAVVGFLPTIYALAGVASALAGWLTALAAAANIVGNVAAGRLLERGVRPLTLLRTAFVAMAIGAVLAFMPQLDARLQYAAVLVFSAVGGLIPATLFSLSVRLAPSPVAVSSTVGWMQQWSAIGQFTAPPLVAWVVVRAGGWQWTGAVCLACCAVGLLLSGAIHRALGRAQQTRAA